MQPFTLKTHYGYFELIPGVVDHVATQCFTRGHCHSFALAVHKLTGWPLFGFLPSYNHSRGNTPYHCAVQMPDGDFLDVDGPNALERWRRHGWQTCKAFPYTEKQVLKFQEQNYREHDVNAALPFAREVLKIWTTLPVQNQIPFRLKRDTSGLRRIR